MLEDAGGDEEGGITVEFKENECLSLALTWIQVSLSKLFLSAIPHRHPLSPVSALLSMT